jgi:hypothetical protein
MDDRLKEMAWAALQVDDLAVLLRVWGFEEMANQFEETRDALERAAAALESAA